MVESEGTQEAVNQVAFQAATAVMVTLRGMDAGSHLTPTANIREPQQQRHGRPATEKPWFNWNAQDKYVELLNFEMKVTNILERKAYENAVEVKVPVIKNWLGW